MMSYFNPMPNLSPVSMQNQSGAPNMMPYPQFQAQEMQKPGFAQNFKSNIGPILQALGMGIAAGDLGRGAAMLPSLVDNRQQRMAQMQGQQQEAQQRNATAQWFRQKDPEIAAMLDQGIIDGKTALSMYQQKQQGAQPGNQPASVQEYEYAKQNGFEGSFMDYQAGKARQGAGVQYGTTPQWYEMEDGSRSFGVIGSDGSFKPVEMPPGATPLNPEGIAAAKARGAATGKIQGEAAGILPGASLAAQESLRLVDATLADPALSSAVGPIDGRVPGFIRGFRPGVANFDERVEQLKGKAFLTARAELKGGGQITDYEGQRAEAALIRAGQAKSEDEFRAAMLEFKDAIIRGYTILEQQASGGAAPAPNMPTPAAAASAETGGNVTGSGVKWKLK